MRGGVQQTCGNQFLLCFFCTAPLCSAPLWCARAPWLRDRAPSQVAMAVVMADNCHSILAWFASGGVWRGLAKWKAHVWGLVVCRTLGPSLAGTGMSLASGYNVECIRQPPAEIWVASGGLRQRKHPSPRGISGRFWEGSGVGILRPHTSLVRGGTLGYPGRR